jgi:hypothetical protein
VVVEEIQGLKITAIIFYWWRVVSSTKSKPDANGKRIQKGGPSQRVIKAHLQHNQLIILPIFDDRNGNHRSRSLPAPFASAGKPAWTVPEVADGSKGTIYTHPW